MKKKIEYSEWLEALEEIEGVKAPPPGYLPIEKVKELWNCSYGNVKSRLLRGVRTGKVLSIMCRGITPAGRGYLRTYYKWIPKNQRGKK